MEKRICVQLPSAARLLHSCSVPVFSCLRFTFPVHRTADRSVPMANTVAFRQAPITLFDTTPNQPLVLAVMFELVAPCQPAGDHAVKMHG